jgi:hypothetical protein
MSSEKEDISRIISEIRNKRPEYISEVFLLKDNNMYGILEDVNNTQKERFSERDVRVQFVFTVDGPTYLRFTWDKSAHDKRPAIVDSITSKYKTTPSDYVPQGFGWTISHVQEK